MSERASTATPVKYYENEDWFYICSTSITIKEANVICRENGYENGAESVLEYPKSGVYYSIYPNDFNCNGGESSLCDCEKKVNDTCGDNIAVVICNSPGM